MDCGFMDGWAISQSTHGMRECWSGPPVTPGLTIERYEEKRKRDGMMLRLRLVIVNSDDEWIDHSRGRDHSEPRIVAGSAAGLAAGAPWSRYLIDILTVILLYLTTEWLSKHRRGLNGEDQHL